MISFSSLTRFLIVGGTATAIHYALTAMFVWLGVLAPTPASGIAFLISASLNYLANARFTFGGKHRHARAFPRFVITACAGCLINVTALYLLVSFGLSFVVSQLVATALVLVWNYLINALWTFRRPSP